MGKGHWIKVRRQQAGIPGLGYAPAGRKLDVDVFPFSDIRRRSPASMVRAAHRYDFHLLLLVTDGSPRQMVDFEPIQCSPGSLLVLRPGQVHSFGEALDWEGWLIMFPAEFLPGATELHTDLLPGRMLERMPDHQLLQGADFRASAGAITAMAADARADLKNIEVIHTLLRYQLCTLILRLQLLNEKPIADAAHHRPAARRFERFRELLEANFAIWRQIGPYANALACTQKSLNRATREAAGRSAKDMIARRIALEAKRLLAHTDRPVYLIAEGLGFGEATNFSKFFRKHASQSPAQFRVAHRA